MRLSRDNVIVVGIVVAITAAYVLVVYRGQSATLSDLSAKAAACKREMEANATKAGPIPSMAREIEAMRRRYNKDWDRRLPKRRELAEFLREISANLSDERLSNQVIEPGRPTPGPLYNRLPITMRFEGEFLALAGFLQRVGDMTRLTRIEKLKIQPMHDSNGLSIELGMNIYFTEQ